MNRTKSPNTYLALIAVLALGELHAITAIAQDAKPERPAAEAAPQPSVSITSAPPRGQGPDSTGTISGTATNIVGDSDVKIVILCLTNQWYVQPTAAEPFTDIGADGKWEAEIHLGYEYVALLVKLPYEPPSTFAKGRLPLVGKSILAVSPRVPATKS